jgi:O-antigen/teichoic acid export membrane protein
MISKHFSFFQSDNIRTLKVKKNVFIMFIINGINIITNLAFVPLMIDILNPTVYGLWLSITSIVSLIGFFDIGLGNGLRNKLADAIGKNDTTNAKKYISTTYISMSLIVCLIIAILLLVFNTINWSYILNAPSSMRGELTILIKWIISLFCIQFILKLITSIMQAFQMPAFSSFVIMLGQLFSFFVIYVLIKFNVNATLIDLGIIISISPVLILLISTIILYNGKLKEYKPSILFFDFKCAKEMLSLGGKFFFIQLTSIIIFQANNLIIAQTSNPQNVTVFNIVYKYLGVILMCFTIIATPYWSATTEAFAKNDIKWIKNSIKHLEFFYIIFFAAGLILLFLFKIIFKFWIGPSIQVDFVIVFLMFVYFILQMRWVLYGSFINGIGKIRLQFYITLIESIIHIPLAFFLGKKYGIMGVLISMITISFINILWPPIQINKLLKSDTKGIWGK